MDARAVPLTAVVIARRFARPAGVERFSAALVPVDGTGRTDLDRRQIRAPL